jgi:hypothetical protein
MVRERDLSQIDELIGRWERGDELWFDPPLCSTLLLEIVRLRRLLKDVYPFVADTPMQEEVRAELGDAHGDTRRSRPSYAPGRSACA